MTNTTATETPSRTWIQPTAIFSGLFVLTFLLFYDTAASMVDIWVRSETFAHGFLIFPISSWLVWRIRDRLAQITPEPNYLALPLIFLNGAVWFLADLADINVIRQLALVAFVPLAVFAIWGWPMIREAMFPLLFLFFAVPMGEGLVPPMMDFTADFTVGMVQLTGIPVYREGMFFSLPTGNWSVVEGCSGVRYLIASITLGTLYAYLTYTSYLKRTIFIIASIIVPIIANGFRAYGIVMIAHFSDMKLALGVDHLIYGWVWFGIVIFIMFFIGSFWRDSEEEDTPLPVQTATSIDKKKLQTSAVGVVLLTLAWPAMAWVQSNSFVENLSVNIDLPTSGEWRELDESFTDWTPAYQAPAAELRKYYESNGRKVGLYLGLYINQKQDQELVNSQNVMIEQKHEVWAEKGKGKAPLDLDGQNVEVNESILRSYDQSLYINHWYWIDGDNTSNAYLAKLIDAKMRLFSEKPTAVGIVVYTELGEKKEPAKDTLQAFLDDMMPAIETALNNAVKAN